jgi:RNA polymerase sigma factor (sigma-70 family)
MLSDIWFERCKAGDDSSWATMVRRFSALVYSAPRQMGLPSDVCDDVLQETFLALYKHIDGIDSVGAVPSWLMTTARRIALRYRDRWSRETPLEFLASWPDAISEASTVEALESQVRRLQLKVAMAGLSQAEQRLLRMLYFEERSYAETASTMGRPVGSIGPVRQRSLAHLRHHFHQIPA